MSLVEVERRRFLKRGALLLTALAAPALTYTGCRAMRCSPDRLDATHQRLPWLPQWQVSFTSVRPWTTPLSWLRVEQHIGSPLRRDLRRLIRPRRLSPRPDAP